MLSFLILQCYSVNIPHLLCFLQCWWHKASQGQISPVLTTPLTEEVYSVCNLCWFLSWLMNAPFLLSLSLVKHPPFSVSLSSPLYMPITEHRFSSRVLRNHLISYFQRWWPLATNVASYAPLSHCFCALTALGSCGIKSPFDFSSRILRVNFLRLSLRTK